MRVLSNDIKIFGTLFTSGFYWLFKQTFSENFSGFSPISFFPQPAKLETVSKTDTNRRGGNIGAFLTISQFRYRTKIFRREIGDKNRKNYKHFSKIQFKLIEPR